MTRPAPALDASVAPSDAAPGVAVPTWNEHVAPIVYAKCASCHREGGIAPFSLIEYASARPFAMAMRAATLARTMPPTVIDASGGCNTFRDDVAWLSDAEVDTLGRWAAGGAPEGDPARRPAPPRATAGLDRVDAHVDLGVTYTPPAGVTDQYRCFLADPMFPEDRFVTGYQVVPGDARVVHHVIVYSLPTAEAEQAAARAEAADAAPGYTCFGGPGVTGSAPVALWAPGGDAVRFPDGTGLRLAAGRRVVIQVHYNLLHGSFPDRTRVDFRTEAAVTNEARLVPVAATDINIPAHTADAQATGQRAFPAAVSPRGVRVWGTAPHMHELGRAQSLTARGGGRETCLSSVDQWNFHWQRLFFYATPVDLEPGETAVIACHYDSSTRDTATRRGESTTDEMCLNYLYVTAR